jgi:hypothetical protein
VFKIPKAGHLPNTEQSQNSHLELPDQAYFNISNTHTMTHSLPFGSFWTFQMLECGKVAAPGFDLQLTPAFQVACLGTVFVKCRTQMNSEIAVVFSWR